MTNHEKRIEAIARAIARARYMTACEIAAGRISASSESYIKNMVNGVIEADPLTREVEELRAALIKYGRHTEHCLIKRAEILPGHDQCFCGFKEACHDHTQ